MARSCRVCYSPEHDGPCLPSDLKSARAVDRFVHSGDPADLIGHPLPQRWAEGLPDKPPDDVTGPRFVAGCAFLALMAVVAVVAALALGHVLHVNPFQP